MFEGCFKVFSRKQECPALSSAEAELCAMTENSKELVSLGQHDNVRRPGESHRGAGQKKKKGVGVVRHVAGIYFGWDSADHFGTPQCTTGTYQLVLRNDAQERKARQNECYQS